MTLLKHGVVHGDSGSHVDDQPDVMRRCFEREAPNHDEGWKDVSSPPKRKKWLSLPGPLKSRHDTNDFPRVGWLLDSLESVPGGTKRRVAGQSV